MAAKILKGADALGGDSASSGKVVKRAVYESGRTASDIVEAAREQAAELLAEAEERQAEILEAARREGHDEGLAQWNEHLQAMAKDRDAYLARCEQQVLQLSVHIAEKIIGESLKLQPDLVVSIVREALKSARQARQATIRVHPDAVKTVQGRLEELERVHPGECVYSVAGDDTVAAGGCVIQTETGSVDAQLESQLRLIAELLTRESKR